MVCLSNAENAPITQMVSVLVVLLSTALKSKFVTLGKKLSLHSPIGSMIK